MFYRVCLNPQEDFVSFLCIGRHYHLHMQLKNYQCACATGWQKEENGKTCDKREKPLTCVFCCDLPLTLLRSVKKGEVWWKFFSNMIEIDTLVTEGFAVFFPLPSCSSSSGNENVFLLSIGKKRKKPLKSHKCVTSDNYELSFTVVIRDSLEITAVNLPVHHLTIVLVTVCV